MLRPGQPAPDFTLAAAEGTPVTLSKVLASGPVLLYFYPADFTPGCTREACDLRDLHGELAAAGLTVLGVSPQEAASHQRFAAAHNLPFALLADPDRRVTRLYDALGPFGLGVRRVTYLIGRDGLIADRVTADLAIGRHRQFARRAAASLKDD
jgi:peroxiredoxin Q/BCP